MVEGFLEMQIAVHQIQGRLEIDGESEYRKIEFGTERFLHTPEPGHRLYSEGEPQQHPRRKWWFH